MAAGVSLSTVDRVINRRGGVSGKAEAKVLEWASKLDLDRKVFHAHLRVLRIAVLIQAPHNPFFETLRDAFAELEAISQDVRLTCLIHHIEPADARGTAARIRELSASYDGMIICCPDHPAVSDALRAASQRIPVVTLVTDLPNSNRIAYVGPDNRQIGRAAGELMGRFLGLAGGEVLVVLGMQKFAGHQEREMGFRAVLRERFPQCTVVDVLESEEDQTRAGQVVLWALKSRADIRGIYNVSAGNFAIAQQVRSQGREGEIIIITHELTKSRRELLLDGVIDAVIDQNPRLEARRALDTLAAFYNRGDGSFRAKGFTPFNIILRENCPMIDEDRRS